MNANDWTEVANAGAVASVTDYYRTLTSGLALTATDRTICIWLDTSVTTEARSRIREVGASDWLRGPDVEIDRRTRTTNALESLPNHDQWGSWSFPVRGRITINWLNPGTEYEVEVIQDGTRWTTSSITTLDPAALLAGATELTGVSAGDTISEAYITNALGSARGTDEWVKVAGETFTGGTAGLTIQTDRVIVHGCTFTDQTKRCIHIDTDCNRILIAENVMRRWGGKHEDPARPGTFMHWQDNQDAAVWVDADTAVDNLWIIGNRVGSPNRSSNTWNEYNGAGGAAGDHPEGAHLLVVYHGVPHHGSARSATSYDTTLRADGTAKFGHCIIADNVFEGGPFNAMNDFISSIGSNFSRCSGMPGAGGVVASNAVLGHVCDDIFEIEGDNPSVVLAGNFCPNAGPPREAADGPLSVIAFAALGVGPLQVERNIFIRSEGADDFINAGKWLKSDKTKINTGGPYEDAADSPLLLYHNTFTVEGSQVPPEFLMDYQTELTHFEVENCAIRSPNEALNRFVMTVGGYAANALIQDNWAGTPPNVGGVEQLVQSDVFEADNYTPKAAGAAVNLGVVIPGVNTRGPWAESAAAITAGAVRVG